MGNEAPGMAVSDASFTKSGDSGDSRFTVVYFCNEWEFQTANCEAIQEDGAP